MQMMVGFLVAGVGSRGVSERKRKGKGAPGLSYVHGHRLTGQLVPHFSRMLGGGGRAAEVFLLFWHTGLFGFTLRNSLLINWSQKL